MAEVWRYSLARILLLKPGYGCFQDEAGSDIKKKRLTQLGYDKGYDREDLKKNKKVQKAVYGLIFGPR
jgi:hypothetical protein